MVIACDETIGNNIFYISYFNFEKSGDRCLF